jgi:hypothetical protein
MRVNKDGSPDKRYKKNKEDKVSEELKAEFKAVDIHSVDTSIEVLDPNELHTQLLKDNNLKLDFDVLEGTITTRHGIIKLEKPTLVIKASYVQS